MRIPDWMDDATLFQAIHRACPNSAKTNNQIGNLWMSKNMTKVKLKRLYAADIGITSLLKRRLINNHRTFLSCGGVGLRRNISPEAFSPLMLTSLPSPLTLNSSSSSKPLPQCKALSYFERAKEIDPDFCDADYAIANAKASQVRLAWVNTVK